jgi:competence protein ComEA
VSKKEDIITKIKTLTGATGSELTIVFTLLFGLILGTILKSQVSGYQDKKAVNQEVFKILDSLAEAAKQTYTGTDVANNPLILDSTSIDSTIKLATLPKSENKKQSKADKIAGTKFNLNSASKVELMKLPGIGEKTAISIIEYRKIHKFTKISDIKNIKGIGEKKFESMKNFIEVK